jgi:hypothetical protein
MKRSHPARGRSTFLSGSPARFAATLVLALVATTPGFRAVLSDGRSLPAALGQFLAAFGALWVLGSVVAAVLRREPGEAAALEIAEMVPGAAGVDR